ncbi:MAG: addiction module antidote protein [Pseudomonadota bacterium]
MKQAVQARAPRAASETHEEGTVATFRRQPKFAAAYLNAVFGDGDQQEIMTALRYVAEAFGGVAQLARKARLNPTTLYRSLSGNGNPELRSLTAILNAMGMRLGVSRAASSAGRGLAGSPQLTEIISRARAEVRRGNVTTLAALKRELRRTPRRRTKTGARV